MGKGSLTIIALDRGGLVVKSRLRGRRRVPGSKPNSTEDRRVWGLLQAKSYVVAKGPPVGLVRKLGEGAEQGLFLDGPRNFEPWSLDVESLNRLHLSRRLLSKLPHHTKRHQCPLVNEFNWFNVRHARIHGGYFGEIGFRTWSLPVLRPRP
ncbi:hypothetical protein AVEN_54124-1 [Araneus ventricosus]|uniref:Uncharacterized protein n=1 Tax=Araneus ventricosus TaxID=182803 RepID=A0A4Y2BTI1_ARAVE|nr:hypothetical protein AVEN_54124-1 [Araneus ventricosus]